MLDPGPSFPGAWLVPTVMVAIAVVALIAAAVVLRERHHRRRRAELETRLADLEGILVRLSDDGSDGVRHDDDAADDPPSGAHDVAPRGPLSTAISIISRDLGPGLPGPDRVDLRAALMVYERLDEPLTPADLADGLNVSLRSLQRGLSSALGCSPRELILAVKMREAKRRLLDGDCRVQEAARSVGFDDPFHFSRRFKSYYGLAPSEVQERAGRSVA